MNYYGVGVKFGGTQEMLPLYLEKDCWFMGFRREEKPSFYETAQKVQPGDVMIAKAYATAAQAYYYVRAMESSQTQKSRIRYRRNMMIGLVFL